jgi:alpha-tubulin suppressor-like RCC1 family protein
MRSRNRARLVGPALVAGLAGCGSLPSQPDAATDAAVADGAADSTSGADTVDAVAHPPTIVVTAAEPWGSNCPRGGIRIQSAVDYNGNHVIDSEDESMPDQYVCNVYPVGVSAGPRHSCALASDGSVRCWGADDTGQLGDYAEHAAYAPRPVGGVETALALAVGGDFACVILPTTGVRCWGKSDRGQTGHGALGPFITPSCVNLPGGSALLGATSLATGGAHACAARTDGTVYCWGRNDTWQLADGTTLDRSQPVPAAVVGARSVAAGGRHTCALLDDSSVRCWGGNDQGQLGDGTTTARAEPVVVTDGTTPLAGVTALAAGDAFTCALMDDTSVRCWGANNDCQLGVAAMPSSPLPVAAPVRDAVFLAAGTAHACAVLASGKAVCWGKNDFGQIGAPAGDCRPVPVELPLPYVTAIAAGGSHACAVDEIGLWCWGDNSFGQLGIGLASSARSTHEPQRAVWDLAP